MVAELPEIFNTTTFFLDENIHQGRGENTAVYYGGEQYTYHDLHRLTNKVGNVLKDLGVEIENRVYIALEDTPEFVACFYAVQKIGAGAIVGYTHLSPSDYKYEINLLRPKVVIGDDSSIDRLREAVQGERYPKRMVVLSRNGSSLKENEVDLYQMVDGASDSLEVEPTHKDDYARWGFTGGSTGHPKALPVPHSTLAHSFNSMQPILGFRPDDIILSVPKMFFGYGRTSTIILPFRVGAAAVLFPERSTASKIFELIAKYRPTILVQVPTMMRKMLQTPEGERTDLSSIRLCTCAGEALSAELYHEWKDTFGCEVVNMLGSAEMGYVYVANRPGEVVPGSVGKPIPGYAVKIVDDKGRRVPAGEAGVLMAKGPTSGFYYWHMLEQSREVFQGQWVNTGDLFRQDANGYLWFMGRADSLLKVSGVWISPMEVEDAVRTHAAVVDCAVVGIKDSDGLEKTKAFVVLNKDAAGIDADSIKEHVKQTLSPYKSPRFIAFVDDLPKTSAGKIDRSALKTSEL